MNKAKNLKFGKKIGSYFYEIINQFINFFLIIRTISYHIIIRNIRTKIPNISSNLLKEAKYESVEKN